MDKLESTTTQSTTSSTSSSSAPLKKRNLSGDESVSSQHTDEQAAAAALTALNKASKKSGASSTAVNDESGGDVSDSEDSISSRDSIPKPVHKPPVNNTMVDHTYTDYSVVDENLLAFLQAEEEHPDHENEISEDEKKTKEKALQKIKKIFGDISPTRKNSGGVVKPFPEKLMEVLDRGDMDTFITWLPHGRAFIVRHSQKLKEVVLPRFFKQSKFMSFTRQLNLWGFKRITKGTDAGAYYHELFLRGRPLLSTLMRRQKIKGTGIKLTPNPDTEPNFYKISDKRPLPPVNTDRELEPLPPISTSLSVPKNASKPEVSDPYLPGGNPNSLDMYMHQQRMEQQSQLQGLRQAQVPLGRIGGGSFSGLPSHQAPYQDNHLAEMLQREAHLRPMPRLSAPTTSADFNLVAGSFQKKAMEQHAIATAQQVLNEVNTHPAVAVQNPVEDLKQKLLNAVHTLEQSQAVSSAATAPPPPPQSLNAPSLTQSLIGQRHAHAGLAQHQGLLPTSQAGLPQLYPYQSNAALGAAAAAYPPSNSLLPHQHQPQAFLGQAPPTAPPAPEPSRESIAALMTALDQTRQVAAAAQAQSSLLQQVANDLALGRHSKK